MKNIFLQLVSLANDLDKKGLYVYANRIDSIVRSAIYTLPPDPFEGADTQLTTEQINEIIDRWNTANSGEDVSVKILGHGDKEKIILQFPSGPDVELTGADWDRLQVMLGIM